MGVYSQQVDSVGGSFCLVGALLALASGKAERRQVYPLKLHLCNLWEAIPNSSFCEFCEICGRSSSASRSNPWEPLLSHRFSPHYKYCVLFRAAHGAWADGCRDGADRCRGVNIVRYCTENAVIETKSVKTPPPNVQNCLIFVNWKRRIICCIGIIINLHLNRELFGLKTHSALCL